MRLSFRSGRGEVGVDPREVLRDVIEGIDQRREHPGVVEPFVVVHESMAQAGGQRCGRPPSRGARRARETAPYLGVMPSRRAIVSP
jgi:hypothetical protein